MIDAPDAGEAAADAEAESDLLPFCLAPATLTEPEEESAVEGPQASHDPDFMYDDHPYDEDV